MGSFMREEDDRWKGFLLGAAGGVAGLLAMRAYWKLATAFIGEDPRSKRAPGEPDDLDDMGVAGQHHRKDESSTAAAGRIAYEEVTGEEPTEETRALLSTAVHWGYGMMLGGLYGALRGRREGLDLKGGLVFGSLAWLLGDELLVPLLGLSKGPTAFPAEQHAHRRGAHMTYGLATSVATQALFGMITPRRRLDFGLSGVKGKAFKKMAELILLYQVRKAQAQVGKFKRKALRLQLRNTRRKLIREREKRQEDLLMHEAQEAGQARPGKLSIPRNGKYYTVSMN